jgi:hypothetical protein
MVDEADMGGGVVLQSVLFLCLKQCDSNSAT